MKLSKEEVRSIAFGAVLHDIGKLLVHDRILNKPGRLNDEEADILRKHPEIGAGIIENMEFLAGTVPLVRHHHEWFDGRGYPDGLRGEDIPIGARIIAVTDSFDAMTTHRPYRDALAWATAKDTLLAKSESQFDAEVVRNFIELIEVDGFRPRSFTRFTVVDKT
jgi:putative two-component system response regulator